MSSDSLLPEALRDEHNLAIENCIKTELDIDLKDFLVTPYERLSGDLLQYMAKEAHVTGYEGWNLALTEKEKRNLIINSFSTHSKKGTKKSIEEAISALNMEINLLEFWEYGGRPAHFKVNFLNLYDRGLDDELPEQIIKIINAYKPASRILDAVIFYLCSLCALYVITHIKTTETITVRTKGEVI